MLTGICKQTVRYLMSNLSLDLWLCFTHAWWLQDLANLSFFIHDNRGNPRSLEISGMWACANCPVYYTGCDSCEMLHCRAPVSVLSAWCHNNPLLFPSPSQVRATWLWVWQFSTSQAVSAASALPGGEEADWAYCLLTHIMTSYKPNSVKDNKDKCCRSGQGLRALSVLTRGERNRLDRQHRKGKTFVAVVRAAVIYPMRCRDRGHVTLTNDVLAPCPDIAPHWHCLGPLASPPVSTIGRTIGPWGLTQTQSFLRRVPRCEHTVPLYQTTRLKTWQREFSWKLNYCKA